MLGGGLAGSIFTISFKSLYDWFQRPRLKAEFGNEVKGAFVKHPFSCREYDSSTHGAKQWTRVKITNNGRATARNVRLIIGCIYNRSQNREWSIDSEVIDCNWAHLGETRIDIPPNTSRFADIMVIESVNQADKLMFTGKGAKNIPDCIERLSIKAMISSDNCETSQFTMFLRYQGLAQGMTFESTPQGSNV